MTAANLKNAHGGESMAHMRYKIWGRKAEQEGFPNVARLFRAISRAETVHASNHFRELKSVPGGTEAYSATVFGLNTTMENLGGAIEGENFEIREMYPVYLETARFQKESGAERSFHYALSAERIHFRMFSDARDRVRQGKDIELGPVQICEVCGYTLEGDAPGTCPICNADKDKFAEFS